MNSLPGYGVTTIGYGSNSDYNGINNATAIGYNATVSASNSLVLGSEGVKVGIGTSNPYADLHVMDSTGPSIFRLQSSNEANYYGSKIEFVEDDTKGFTIGYTNYTNSFEIKTKNYPINTEKTILHIDSIGRVGVGGPAPDDCFTVFNDDTASVKVSCDAGKKSSLKLFEENNYGFEMQYDGSVDKLYLWSREFYNNEEIRMTWEKSGNIGIGTDNPNYLLQVGESGDGNIAVGNSWNTFSDRRFKKDIVAIDSPLDKLINVNGYYYNWKSAKGNSRQIGFIAQELENVLPEVVSTGEDGYKSVDYSKMTPLLVEAVKEQQKMIKLLLKRIEVLENR